jgi:hypothetical protein
MISSPHVLMRPKLSLDGNKWCALYGDSLQDGVAGFGDSPALAMEDFDRQWRSTDLAKKVANKPKEHKAVDTIVLGQLWDGGPEI